MTQENFWVHIQTSVKSQEVLMANVGEWGQFELGWDIFGQDMEGNTHLDAQELLRYYNQALRKTWLWKQEIPSGSAPGKSPGKGPSAHAQYREIISREASLFPMT